MKKIDNFFGLWASTMAAGGENGDDDPLGQLLDQVFQEEYKDGREALGWLEDELKKIKDPALRGKLKDAAAEVINKTQYLYLAAGFALGGLYDVMDPEARAQIEYLKKRIHDGGIFPMAAKLKAPDTRELCASAAVADGREEKKRPVPENGHLAISQAAAFLGFSEAWLYKKARAKIVPHVRLGRNYLFDKKELENWLKAHSIKGALKI